MADVNHTPGAWTFDNRSMTGAVWAEKEFIASVYPNAPEGWDGASDYERVDEMRANARLIAASPDLLAVAKKSHEPYEGLSEADIRSLYGAEEAALALALRTAIAKAGGQ